jgi:hypothetical protein
MQIPYGFLDLYKVLLVFKMTDLKPGDQFPDLPDGFGIIPQPFFQLVDTGYFCIPGAHLYVRPVAHVYAKVIRRVLPYIF